MEPGFSFIDSFDPINVLPKRKGQRLQYIRELLDDNNEASGSFGGRKAGRCSYNEGI
jgi:hypothetical protein